MAALSIYLGLFWVSAATLAFEVVLTRLFALAQGHHFAFMAVSLALLGGGASGSFLSLRPVTPAQAPRRLMAGAFWFTLTAPGSFWLANALPFDAYRIAVDGTQLAWLALYYLLLTLPLFFSSLVVGAALVAWPEQANRMYAASLLGSGSGLPLALLALAVVGGPGAVFGVACLGSLALIALSWGATRRSPRRWPVAGLGVGLCLVCAGLAWQPPADIRLTPYQSLSQALLYPGSRIVQQTWNAFSRVDIVDSPGIRSAPGLSMAYVGKLPRQLGLTVDGQNLSPITPDPTEAARFVEYLPPALAYRLRPQAEALIVEPGGGLAVLTARRLGAATVTAVHSNPAVAEAVYRWGGDLYRDPLVMVVVDEARSYLRRSEGEFDLVVLPLTDSYRAVTAGAYALGEDYRYTVEAFQELWRHLKPDGLLAAERWLQLPPSESLRLWGSLLEAVRRSGIAEPAQHLIALRSMQTSLIIASRRSFTANELQQVGEFAASHQFDLIWTPELQDVPLSADDAQLAARGVNRYNVVRDDPYFHTFVGLLRTGDAASFYADYPYAVAPPTDDRPFFFHFFKWQQIPTVLANLGRSWQPFGGSGYLVLVAMLGLVLVLSLVLILLPLLVRRQATSEAAPGAQRPATLRSLLYFLMLGLAFLLVEMPLLQQFIVYLGQPAYAFATVVGFLLVSSGVGSRYLSTRLPLVAALAGLIGLIVLYPLLLSPVFNLTFGLPLIGRVVVTGLLLAPAGVLMGIPFPAGLAIVRRVMPARLPWIWAVNGCASVISAVLAPMLALDLGFRLVLLLGAAAYGLALLARPRPA